MAKNRVVFYSTSDNIGGMERIVCRLSKRFSERDWNVTTIVPDTDKAGLLEQWLNSEGVATTRIAGVGGLEDRSFRDIPKIVGGLRRLHPRIVNLHYGDNFIPLKDLMAVRLSGASGIVPTLHQAKAWDEERAQKRHNTKSAARFCSSIIAICEATRTLLHQADVDDARIRVIRCGIEPPARTPDRKEARALFGLPEEGFYIVTMANLTVRKGVADLITAVAELLADLGPEADIRLVIGGDGVERANLERLAAEKLGERCRFVGRILGDTSFLYAAGDVFALTSYDEGVPLVYIEAAFHGTPSIGTDVGGTAEIVRDNETGILVQPKDIAGIKAALARMYQDREFRDKTGRTAKRNASEQWTESLMAEKYDELFRSLL